MYVMYVADRKKKLLYKVMTWAKVLMENDRLLYATYLGSVGRKAIKYY